MLRLTQQHLNLLQAPLDLQTPLDHQISQDHQPLTQQHLNLLQAPLDLQTPLDHQISQDHQPQGRAVVKSIPSLLSSYSILMIPTQHLHLLREKNVLSSPYY